MNWRLRLLVSTNALILAPYLVSRCPLSPGRERCVATAAEVHAWRHGEGGAAAITIRGLEQISCGSLTTRANISVLLRFTIIYPHFSLLSVTAWACPYELTIFAKFPSTSFPSRAFSSAAVPAALDSSFGDSLAIR